MRTTKKTGTSLPKAATHKKAGAGPGRRPVAEPSRVGKRGSIVIPAALRRRYGIEEGSFSRCRAPKGGVLIVPVSGLPIETISPQRKAQFLLSNALDAADYADAVAEVRTMGLDPNTIPHYKPPGVLTCGLRLQRRQRVALRRLVRRGAFQRLRRLDGVNLLSSGHPVEEARRNLDTAVNEPG